MGWPTFGENQAQVIVNLGGGRDRRAGVHARAVLLDGDGRREALDVVHFRLLHLFEEWRAYAERLSTYWRWPSA